MRVRTKDTLPFLAIVFILIGWVFWKYSQESKKAIAQSAPHVQPFVKWFEYKNQTNTFPSTIIECLETQGEGGTGCENIVGGVSLEVRIEGKTLGYIRRDACGDHLSIEPNQRVTQELFCQHVINSIGKGGTAQLVVTGHNE